MLDHDNLNAQELLERIDKSNIPQHIAVIMDGNRRWAKNHYLPAIMGHKAGVKSFHAAMETCLHLGVKYFTAYAFSSENWHRSATEVGLLMQLFEYYAQAERQEMLDNGIHFHVLGDMSVLPESVRRELQKTEEVTSVNKQMALNLAVNYGGREELLRATRILAEKVKQGEIDIGDIDSESFSQALYTKGIPDPDLLIRTSGEIRLSNFLLWQCAYTEFYFSPVCWPDVDDKFIYRAILEFQNRSRRYGS